MHVEHELTSLRTSPSQLTVTLGFTVDWLGRSPPGAWADPRRTTSGDTELGIGWVSCSIEDRRGVREESWKRRHNSGESE